jgi:hypothetical protein
LTAPAREIAPAKLNLALHVRGKLPDGRHAIETVFAFCTDGDGLSGDAADSIELNVTGPFAAELGAIEDNLVFKATQALAETAGVREGAAPSAVVSASLVAGLDHGKPFSETYASKSAATTKTAEPPTTHGQRDLPRTGAISSRAFGPSVGSSIFCLDRP